MERVTTTTTFSNRAYRFISQNENDGLRWSTGDTIDLFFLDT
jgi:hypothetical protein